MPTNTQEGSPNGVGLGLRWSFLEEVSRELPQGIPFFEIAPENYARRGGRYRAALKSLHGKIPIITHGLTMSLGAMGPPPEDYFMLLEEVRDLVSPLWHSDHLCFSTVGDLILHDLFPIAFTQKNAERVARNLQLVQERLGMKMCFENISYYAEFEAPEMTELQFIHEILERSEADLLLDVNNIYVNQLNHGSNAEEFLQQLPWERVRQMHIAGHERKSPSLVIDTHGESVCPEVMALFKQAILLKGPVPVTLERDNNIPPLDELLNERAALQKLYDSAIAERIASQPKSAIDGSAQKIRV